VKTNRNRIERLCAPALAGLLGLLFVSMSGAQDYDAITSATRFAPPEDRGYLAHPVRIMNRETMDAYQLDPATGETAVIAYSVSKTGWVRVRLVRRADHGMVLRTLQDWKLVEYGRDHRIIWDGTDASGNRVEPRRTFILFEGIDRSEYRVHWDHEEAACHDLQIKLARIPGKLGEAPRIVAQFTPGSGVPPAAGFEGRLYIDQQLVTTVRFPGGSEQFVFTIEPAWLKRPDALVAVNIDDGQDHVGAASLRLTTTDTIRPSGGTLAGGH